MPQRSSKIPKKITGIVFARKSTKITFSEKFTPNGQNEAIEETWPLSSTMKRHSRFDRAMERMKVHFVIRLGFALPVDRLEEPIDKTFFDDHVFEDDWRFENVEVTGVHILTKEDQTAFNITAVVTTEDSKTSTITCPSINLLKSEEGFNYPLIDLAKDHLDALIDAADGYLNYQTQLDICDQHDHAA